MSDEKQTDRFKEVDSTRLESTASSQSAAGHSTSLTANQVQQSKELAVAQLSSSFQSGEALLWSGTPDIAHLRHQMLVGVIVSAVFLCVLIAMGLAKPVMMPLYCALSIFPAGFAWYSYNLQKGGVNIVYGITNKQIYIMKREGLSFSTKSVAFENIKAVDMTAPPNIRLFTSRTYYHTLIGLTDFEPVVQIIQKQLGTTERFYSQFG